MEAQSIPDAPPEFDTPDWVHHAVFYQIFPDRFAESNLVPKPSNLEAWEDPPTTFGFKGGDLLGIAERLDYLKNLGVTALYLNPIFKSTANHRYHTYDYRTVDPILGGDTAFRSLLDEAHRRGVRIVLDGVFNHVGRGFFQFSHLLENGEASPYVDWFTVSSWPLNAYSPEGTSQGYRAWWGHAALPALNLENPAVRQYLLDVAAYWTEQGIDGWRLDVPNEIDDDFWREFRRRVKAINSEAYIVGEIWGDARQWLQGDEFDAVMNYVFTRACLGFFGPRAGIAGELLQSTGLANIDRLTAEDFRSTIDSLLARYPPPTTLAQLNLLDSHDMPRFLTLAQGDESALRLATLFQMTFPGAPCVYYGDEIGLQGGPDPDCRRAFPWDSSLWNGELHDYVRRCIALRRAHPVLRIGDHVSLLATNGIYAFLRQLGDQAALVVLNTSIEPQVVDLGLPSGLRLADTFNSWLGATPDVRSGAPHGWEVPPRSGDVLLGSMLSGPA